MTFNIIRAVNFTSSRLSRLNGILEIFVSSVNNPVFSNAILNHAKFRTAHNFSNEQILSKILEGREIYSNEDDREADLYIVLKSGGYENEIGRTVEDRIFTYSESFLRLSDTRLAGHYAHEYCHLLSFEDPVRKVDLPFNVPYEVGRIVVEIAESSRSIFLVSESVLLRHSNKKEVSGRFVLENNIYSARELERDAKGRLEKRIEGKMGSRKDYLRDQKYTSIQKSKLRTHGMLNRSGDAGATTCKRITKTGEFCSRRVSNFEFCWQHSHL